MLKRVLSLLLVASAATPLLAQGLRTGVLTGVVTVGGSPIEGATVTVSSPALQGTRTATTDALGAYILKGLPPGRYTITFAQGTLTAEQKAEIAMGETVQRDAALGVTASVDVSAEAAPIAGPAAGGATYKSDEIDLLPVGRSPVGMAALAPGLTTNTPNGGQLTISGGFGYDNVFLVDGVDINDNVFGSPDNLYIEEAMEETQVLTSGIPAEFGRFAGGVVNVVSKKGGNRFSGSLRADLANASWRSLTPFEEQQGIELEDDLSKVFQATLGGPILKDRLWFFGGARRDRSTFSTAFDRTGIPYTAEFDDDRYSMKLTGRLAEGHTLESSYLRSSAESFGPSFFFTIDPAAIASPKYPSSLFVANYGGTLRDDLFLEVQYSQKKQGFRDAGGTSEAIEDSPFITATQSLAQYNAPYFDSTDPEDRNNRQLTASLSYYLSTRRFGRHDLKGGFEHFKTSLVGGNSPSSTSFVFTADYLTDAQGRPVIGDDGRLVPVFFPEVSGLSFTLAERGAQLDIRTRSFFVNDRMVLNNRFSVSAGFRYEQVRSEATGGISGIDTDTLVPRFGVRFDPKGDGRWFVQAGFAEYAGKYNEAQFGQNTSVGNPESYEALYIGPPGAGLDFAPGFDLDNYAIVGGTFPTGNVVFDPDLSSPVARELSLSVGRQLASTTWVAASFLDRRFRGFVEDFVTLDGGFTNIEREGLDFGNFDNQVYRNSDEPERRYQALELQGRYRFTERWLTEGSWTVQLKNEGNFVGEAPNQPALTSLVGDYPEMLIPERNFPVGKLPLFQRHKLRLWSRYRLGLGRAGSLDIAGLWRFDSALSYSLRAGNVPLSDIQLARDPGYQRPPVLQTLFFDERGSEDFEGVHLLNAALTYTVPVWKSAKPYIKFEAFNILNTNKLLTWDTTIFPDFEGPLDGDGLPTSYIENQLFGQATGPFDYAPPREFTISAGVRF